MSDTVLLNKGDIVKAIDKLAAESLFNDGDDALISASCIKRICEQLPQISLNSNLVRCENCIYATPLEKHCVYSSKIYLNCSLGRGDFVQNVWHKYTKKYRDYSLVDKSGFCDCGEAKVIENTFDNPDLMSSKKGN